MLGRPKAGLKNRLQSLPVTPGGVAQVHVKTARSVINAAARYSRALDVPSQRLSRISQVSIWIAFRLTSATTSSLANLFGGSDGTIWRAIDKVDRRIRHGDADTIADVEGILQVLAAPIIVSDSDAGKVIREVTEGSYVVEPEVATIRKWRERGFTVKGISKYTGISQSRIASVLGIQWDKDRA